ncbi:Transcription initiation factor IIB [Camellia lanceoleosa]|uniref:Transcription initiation factor IIB n=1 Tax=Camellia lanceoleosa TaxID=1840588 RepID=A0ACC0HGB6_9ERIC|nr:Transcription initiation factor IIB [Camellia lanceoleosa]
MGDAASFRIRKRRRWCSITFGDTVCSECGFGIALVDETSEWRTFNESRDNDRSELAAPPTLLTDGRLSTIISKPNAASPRLSPSSAFGESRLQSRSISHLGLQNHRHHVR